MTVNVNIFWCSFLTLGTCDGHFHHGHSQHIDQTISLDPYFKATTRKFHFLLILAASVDKKMMMEKVTLF